MSETAQDLIDPLSIYDPDQPVCVAISTGGKSRESPIETVIEGKDGLAIFCFGEKGAEPK